MQIRAVLLVALGWCATPAWAATIFVDAANPICPGVGTGASPFCKIQDAIAAAVTGDVIQVAPGIYVENLDFLGKGVRVESVAGPATTIIDGGNAGSCVRFVQAEGPDAQLVGFTLQNGDLNVVANIPFVRIGGLGVYMLNASPRIEGNEFGQQGGFTDLFGVGVYAEGGSPQIVGNRFAIGTSAVQGGSIYCTGCQSPLLQGNDITGSDAIEGAGIFLDGCNNPRVLDNQVQHNGSVVPFGGWVSGSGVGLTARGCTDLEIRGNRFADNAGSGEGGAIGIAGSTGVIEDNVLEANFANSGGGGLDIHTSQLVVRHNTLESNAGLLGGAVLVHSGTVTFADNLVLGNSGGLFFGAAIVGLTEVSRCVFSGTVGGAVNGGGESFEDCLIVNNSYGLLDPGSLRRCTVSGNSVGIDVSSGTTIVDSSIVFQNSLEIAQFGGTAMVSDSLVLGGFVGTNVINANPAFVNAAGGDYRLQASSPCIDAGAAADPACGVDVAGLPRRVSGLLTPTARVDMGAHEFSNVVLTVTELAPLSFQVDSSGTAGLSTLLFVGVAPGQVCLPPAGTLLMSVTPTLLVLGWLPLPSSVVVNVPPSAGLPPSIYLQQLALGSAPNTANLSGLAILDLQ